MHEGGIGGLATEVQESMLLRCLLGVPVSQQQYVRGARSNCEVQSPTFQGENPRSDLNLLYLAMALSKALFWKWDYLQGENLDLRSGDDDACALFRDMQKIGNPTRSEICSLKIPSTISTNPKLSSQQGELPSRPTVNLAIRGLEPR